MSPQRAVENVTDHLDRKDSVTQPSELLEVEDLEEQVTLIIRCILEDISQTTQIGRN